MVSIHEEVGGYAARDAVETDLVLALAKRRHLRADLLARRTSHILCSTSHIVRMAI
jgi:hypothetical protein